MKIGYARVSTMRQGSQGTSLESQERALLAAGCERVVLERASGKQGNHRPKLDALLQALQPGDELVVTKLDRISRSILDGKNLMQSLSVKGINFTVLNMGTFDNTASGRLMQSIFLAFAEFERDMILQRTQEGRVRWLENNPDAHDGRPPKYSQAQLDHAHDLLADHSYKQVSEMTGISEATLYRYCRRDPEAAPQRTYTTEELAAASALIDAGHTYREVEKLTGISKSTIARYRQNSSQGRGL